MNKKILDRINKEIQFWKKARRLYAREDNLLIVKGRLLELKDLKTEWFWKKVKQK